MNPPLCRIWDGCRFSPDATLPVADRAARYGMALFETVRVRQGRAERLLPHLESLRSACRVASFPDPATHLAAPWRLLVPQAVPDLLASADPHATGVLRIHLTAGDGNPLDPVQQPRLFLLFEPRPAPPAPPAPIRLGPVRNRPAPYPASCKSTNYWANLDALRDSRADGFDECPLQNADGTLRSACLGNLFLRLGGEWLTPPPADGARPGTVRQFLLDRGFAREASIPAACLPEADAVLVTNSWLGIATAVSLAGRPLALPESIRTLATEFDRAQ